MRDAAQAAQTTVMIVRRTLSLLAALALFTPLLAAAAPVCAPGHGCPMAAGAASPACHGSALKADDCCLTADAAAAVEAAPTVAAASPSGADGAPAAQLDVAAVTLPPAPVDPPSAPLYRLFRALLI